MISLCRVALVLVTAVLPNTTAARNDNDIFRTGTNVTVTAAAITDKTTYVDASSRVAPD